MSSPQLKICENVITQPQYIVESFADHFSWIFNSPSSVVVPSNARFIPLVSKLSFDFRL
jgi:hypothetical protein